MADFSAPQGATEQVTLLASAARTASGNSGTLTVAGELTSATIQLRVTAASGATPTLNVYVQTSYDDGTTWTDLLSFAQATAAGRWAGSIGPGGAAVASAVATDGALAAASVKAGLAISNKIRIAWVTGGVGPSFTFDVAGVFVS